MKKTKKDRKTAAENADNPPQKKRVWLFQRKRPFEENFDSSGQYIQRNRDWQEVYADYYGPVVEDEKSHKAGKFFLHDYLELGHPNIIGGSFVVLLFILYFAWGIYNLYFLGGEVRTAYNLSGFDISAYTNFLKIAGIAIGVVFLIWIVSLALSYLFVRAFAEIVGVMMFGLCIIEIVLLGFLYWKIEWQYNWIFLAAAIPNFLFLTIWYNKLKKAIYVFRMSTLVVAKQRELLLPQITQTLWILFLSLFHIITSFSTFLNITPTEDLSFTLNGSEITLTAGIIYSIYTVLFVFCVFVVLFVSQGMKMLMIHNWYRGGESMGFWNAFRVIRYRWWGITGYAIASTAVRLVRWGAKLLKGELGPKNIQECFTKTGEFIPNQVNALQKKKDTPIYERLWLGLNKYTLPAVVIENYHFVPALFRSLFLIIRDIPQQYIKASHVNVLFFVIKYALMVINGILGVLVGYFFGYLLGFESTMNFLFAGIGGPLFLWIGGGTSTLIVNDLNNSYITIMYIHTVDEMNKKEEYTIEKLKKLRGDVHILLNKPKWYQFKKMRSYKATLLKNEAHPENQQTVDIFKNQMQKPRWYQIFKKRKWNKFQKRDVKKPDTLENSEPTEEKQ